MTVNNMELVTGCSGGRSGEGRLWVYAPSVVRVVDVTPLFFGGARRESGGGVSSDDVSRLLSSLYKTIAQKDSGS